MHRPWRKVKVTEDYAQCTRDLVDIHYPMPRSSGSSRIIYRPTRPAPCIRRSRARTQADLATARVPLHPQARTLAQHGQSRSRPARSAASDRGSTTPNDYAAKSQPGSDGEMPPAPASNGCSQQTRPAPKWALPLPKSHKTLCRATRSAFPSFESSSAASASL